MQKMNKESLKRSTEIMMEPSEIDESGSLHFQAPPKQEEENVSSSPAPVKERRVTFHHRVRCRRSKTAQPECEGRWYTKEEIAGFRQRDKYLQTLITSRSTSLTGEDDTEDDSLIGLHSERDRKLRTKRVREARACVMGEQQCQEEKFFKDEEDLSGLFKLDQEIIAEFYSSYSQRATKLSQMLGLQVSWHVEKLWEEEEEDKEESSTATDIDVSHNKPCSQHSISSSNSRPARNSSLRSAGGTLIARLTQAAA